MGELLVVGVELPELLLVGLRFLLEGLEGGSRVDLLAPDRFGQKGIDGAGGFRLEAELVELAVEETEFSLELVAPLDVRNVPALEGRELGVELCVCVCVCVKFVVVVCS